MLVLTSACKRRIGEVGTICPKRETTPMITLGMLGRQEEEFEQTQAESLTPHARVLNAVRKLDHLIGNRKFLRIGVKLRVHIRLPISCYDPWRL